ncbi:hypothetical protein [Streptomyces sp. NPDC059761]|uniref:hypothetical protein n=1 Tax=Streptomyces sp. NPDC059761 TaxID=3346937 RepID=UPI0036692C97
MEDTTHMHQAAPVQSMPPLCDKPDCAGTELSDVMGHDHLGHKAANTLMRKANVATVAQLRAMGMLHIRDLPTLGPKVIQRIMDRVPDIPREDTEPKTTTRYALTAQGVMHPRLAITRRHIISQGLLGVCGAALGGETEDAGIQLCRNCRVRYAQMIRRGEA